MVGAISGSSGWDSGFMMTAGMRRGNGNRKPPPSAEELFTKTDTDGSGSISRDELTNALSNRPKMNAENGNAPDASELFGSLDADGNGEISGQEHSDGLKVLQEKMQSQAGMFMAGRMPPPPPPDSGNGAGKVSDELFSETDENSDGSISHAELAYALKNMGSANEDGEIISTDELFSSLDADGDGSITKDEHGAGLKAMKANMYARTEDGGTASQSYVTSAMQQYRRVQESFSDPVSAFSGMQRFA